MIYKLLLSIYSWFYLNNFFSITVNFSMFFHISNLIQIFQTLTPTYYPLSCHPSCTSIISKFSILTMIYFVLGFKSFSPKFLLAMSANCRPLSHHSILCIFHFSPFLTKCTLLEMCLVCLVSLPF